jgi:hypothetical protein
VALLATVGHATASTGRDEVVPRDVRLSKCFYCFNLPGVNWTALEDERNGPLLHACLGGATRPELEALGVPGLDERLRQLREGKIISRLDEEYFLGQPVVVGQRREALRSIAEKAASTLMPTARQAIREIKPLLKEREEMTYHLLWSGIMDSGFTWEVVRRGLAEDLQKPAESVDLRTGWWVYPLHSFDTGTNTFGSSDGAWIITAQEGFAPAHTIRNTIEACKIALIRSSLTGEPLEEGAIPQAVRDYGLVDADGRSRLFVTCPDSDRVAVGMRLATEFARSALVNLDVASIASLLDVTAEQALVIAYHELCYEILGRLSASGALVIPNGRETSPTDVRALVSFYLTTPTEEFLKQGQGASR